MATYLITGGAGFIGSHLARRLVADGHAVRLLDNLSTGKRENVADLLAGEGLGEGCTAPSLFEGDIRSADDCSEAVEGADYVLHQAALPSVPRSINDPLATDDNNVRGTLTLLRAAHAAGVKRVVQASSSSIYGDTPTLPKVETMPLRPRSPYAASKATGELYGAAFFHTYGLEYVALRYFNVFGPRQDPTSQYAAVLPRFITCAIEGTQPTVFGDGKQSRDFCFIDNVVDANLRAATAEGAAGRVFNIACGERTDLLRVLELIGERFGKSLDPAFTAARTGDVKHSLADIDAAREVLGYEPEVRFEEGLSRTIDWFVSQHEGASS